MRHIDHCEHCQTQAAKRPPRTLNINQADRTAAEQTGYPVLFYSIKRRFGDEAASVYLKMVYRAQRRATA